jgi:hypothetical protein
MTNKEANYQCIENLQFYIETNDNITAVERDNMRKELIRISALIDRLETKIKQ